MPHRKISWGGMKARGMFITICWAPLLAVLVALTCARGSRAEGSAAEAHRRFLLLYSAHSTLAANIEATSGITEVLDAAIASDYEVYAEYRDVRRFPGPEFDRRFADDILVKYRDFPFDAILTFGLPALNFTLEHRTEFAPGVPVIFGGVATSALKDFDLPEDVHGVSSALQVKGTLALARALQPNARHAVIFTGSGEFDEWWRARIQKELAGVPGIKFDYVSDLTLEEFQQVAAGLDRDTILIILTIFEDAAGRHFIPANAAALIAERASTPTYTVYSTYVGRGALGGQVETFKDIGASMAELALQIASDDVDASIISLVPSRFIVDWRQMKRFGLDVDLLPQGTELLFHNPSAWEKYRSQILIAMAVIVMQSGTIAALAMQARRRRKAEMEAASRRLELAHLSRIAQLGELSGALAHELNQPLTSILANAEAGAQVISRDPPDMEEVAAILGEIAEDDRRAAGIITDLRRLMAKGEVDLELLDLNKVVSATIRLMRSELIVRGVQVEARAQRGELLVRGNMAQLEQVLLNLMLNAADSMAKQAPEMRNLTIETSLRENGWRELSVRDRGQGVPAELNGTPFRPFATSKPQGLGLGLSICRTIAQSHGGTIAFDDAVTDGARIVLALPPP